MHTPSYLGFSLFRTWVKGPTVAPCSVDFTVSAVTKIPASHPCLGPECGFQAHLHFLSLQTGSLKVSYAQGFLRTSFYLVIYRSLVNKAGTHGLQGRITQKKTSWHRRNISRTFQSWLVLIK